MDVYKVSRGCPIIVGDLCINLENIVRLGYNVAIIL